MTPDPEPPVSPEVPVVEAVATDAVAETTAPAEPVAPPEVAPHGDGHHTPLHTHCENCGTELQGPFCHKCGQHDFDFKQGFGHALHDALENFFHFDTKLFRNIVTLLFRPGVLSAEFNAGHRVAQMPPLRLYVFVSILFFFISFTGDRMPKDNLVQNDEPRRGVRVGAGPQLENIVAEAKKDAAKEDAEAAAEKPAETAPVVYGKTKRANEPKSDLEKALEEKGEYAFRHQHELAEAFAHAIPKMLLFCLPFFALYTRVLFRKSGLAYLQHLVIAVHFHTFIFLWLLFRDGWAGIADLLSHGLRGWVTFAAGLWMTIYPFLMLRRLFGNPWKRTILKTVALAAAYSLTLAVAFGITVLVVFAML